MGELDDSDEDDSDLVECSDNFSVEDCDNYCLRAGSTDNYVTNIGQLDGNNSVEESDEDSVSKGLVTPRDHGFFLSKNRVIEQILIFFFANIYHFE